ncbi:MAG: Uma2 family endonuclease [Acidimicrobiales bacterium]
MPGDPERHVFTVDEYDRMGEAGVFPPDLRLELLGGEIFEMTPIHPPHSSTVNRLTQLLVLALAGRAVVTVQNPVRLGDISQPQPDLLVAAARTDFYSARHPRPEDTLLAIEVSDTTLRWDRRVKRPFYAKSGIPELWIVDVNARHVEVATEPGADDYLQIRTLAEGVITPVLIPDLSVELADILG